MNYFKELKEVEEVTGWGKLYYNFVDLDRYDSMLMLNYLIDTEPIVMQHCFDEGYEDYLQYSDSFIQEKIIGVSPHLIRNMMIDLEKHEYISVHHAGNDIRRPRYVKLNYDKLLKALGIKRCIKGCINDSINAGANEGLNEGLNAGANEGLNDPTNNLAQNRLTNYQTNQTNKLPEEQYYGETSSPDSASSAKENFSEEEATLTNCPDPSDKAEKYSAEINEIVAYLNEKTQSSYRTSTANTRKHIVARLKQCYTVDDFKHVIDVKCAEWAGTEWEQYLRPETLFTERNFENYLNTKMSTVTKNTPPKVEQKKADPTKIMDIKF